MSGVLACGPARIPAPFQPMLRYALFDLDNTLYPADSGLWEAIAERINLYMTERMRLSPAEATAIRRRYLTAFGTTLNGLRLEYAIDPLDYLNFVHDLPLASYLRPRPALDAMLGRLPLVKGIFTNADASHAERVLHQLGIRRHFTHIIDILALDFANKPELLAYRRALDILGVPPAECLFVEDTARNLLPAHDLGMRTVLVGPAPDGSGVDYAIPDILDLENILRPGLEPGVIGV